MSPATRWQVMAGVAGLFLLGATLFARADSVPGRLRFSLFPTEIAGYRSYPVPVSNEALRALKLTDHLSRAYNKQNGVPIGVYVGYHGVQRQGTSIHSPLHCLPGAGWSILERRRIPMPGDPVGRSINRLLIGSGEERQVVYYWYQGRGRVIADEFAAYWYQLQDIALRNRSDAALVRFMIRGDDASAEDTMKRLIEAFVPLLDAYVPA